MDLRKSSSMSNLKTSLPAGQPPDRIKDTRRRRGQLSCAECRRLKGEAHDFCVSCDATECFLVNHVQKGVVQLFVLMARIIMLLSPFTRGTLTGTRFVLANTEEYHGKISDMSDRIRELEEALAQLHPSVSHPLLREDLLSIKVPVELSNKVDTSLQQSKSDPTSLPEPSHPPPPEPHRHDPAVPVLLNSYGTLKMGPSGGSRFFGQTAYAEHFLKVLSCTKDEQMHEEEPLNNSYALPGKLQLVAHAFPNGTQYRDSSIVQTLLDFVPPSPELDDLVDVYYTNSAWMYEPCPRELFMKSLNHVLEHIDDPLNVSLNDLALVFAVLAHGVLVDLKHKPYSPYAVSFHQLSRACLSLSPFMEEPVVSNIQTLFLLGFFWVLFNRKDAPNAGWLIQCLNAKLAQTMGLHRDCDDWGFAEESRKEARRTVFWELMTLEGWMSLGLGRPMTAHVSDIHCAMPAATARAMTAPDSRQITLSAGTPPYRDILELDRSIQANGLVPPESTPEQSPGLEMQRSLGIHAHSTALLLLHRGFFGRALEEETDPMQSKFAPSVLATYTSAWRIILALQAIHTKYPALTHRFGLFWSNTFSASIALCLLVTRATRSSYATGALEGLNIVHELFSAAAFECFPASKAFPVIVRLRDKAQAAYAPYIRGHPTAMAVRGRQHGKDEEDEELRALGGKTAIARLLVPLPSSLLKGYNSSSTERSEEDAKLTGSPMPIPLSSHLESVHPLLLQYVEQSRWVSNGYNEEPPTYANPPTTTASSSNIYATATYHTNNQGDDNNETFAPPSTQAQHQQHQEPYHHLHQATPRQNYHYNDYSMQSTSTTTDYDHAPANTNAWQRSPTYSVHPPEHSQQQNHYQDFHDTQQQQHQHYYTDPSLESYTDTAEYSSNQYAAWQSHLEQLGLPF
ncbi:hypothetical protein BU17DRAFT_67263 [Hysterangium stoloniferum]|nr:hypothetical protein BU17DRAFT_67263 [Hysterangium stoloniferum]